MDGSNSDTDAGNSVAGDCCTTGADDYEAGIIELNGYVSESWGFDSGTGVPDDVTVISKLPCHRKWEFPIFPNLHHWHKALKVLLARQVGWLWILMLVGTLFHER